MPHWGCSCGEVDNWANRIVCRGCGKMGPKRVVAKAWEHHGRAAAGTPGNAGGFFGDLSTVAPSPSTTFGANSNTMEDAAAAARDYDALLPDPVGTLRHMEAHWLCFLGSAERAMAAELSAVGLVQPMPLRQPLDQSLLPAPPVLLSNRLTLVLPAGGDAARGVSMSRAASRTPAAGAAAADFYFYEPDASCSVASSPELGAAKRYRDLLNDFSAGGAAVVDCDLLGAAAAAFSGGLDEVWARHLKRQQAYYGGVRCRLRFGERKK